MKKMIIFLLCICSASLAAQEKGKTVVKNRYIQEAGSYKAVREKIGGFEKTWDNIHMEWTGKYMLIKEGASIQEVYPNKSYSFVKTAFRNGKVDCQIELRVMEGKITLYLHPKSTRGDGFSRATTKDGNIYHFQ